MEIPKETKEFAQKCYYNHRLLWLKRIKYLLSLKDIDFIRAVRVILYEHTSCFACRFSSAIPLYLQNEIANDPVGNPLDECVCLFDLKDYHGYDAYSCDSEDTIYDLFLSAIDTENLDDAIKYAWEIYYCPMGERWR